MANPFKEPLASDLYVPATGLVIFGGTGDLTRRKLVPALYNLHCDGYLPDNFVVVGASRSELSDEEYRRVVREGVQQFSRRVFDYAHWNAFAGKIFYQQVRFTESADYSTLKARLQSYAEERRESVNYLYYLATAPEFFVEIAERLNGAGLVEDPDSTLCTTRLIVEKPFGRDLESAQVLNGKLSQNFAENQIFRIDHYLGKETVQNILVFRFSNGILEPLWNHKYIEQIQVSMCESIGVGSRAGYFDSNGLLRDIVQNHLLQVISLLCIEPPVSLDADSIRDEKVKVLRSMRRFEESEVRERIVRGQYAEGFILGDKVAGYLQEDGVPRDSSTETYVAMELAIDNWRWAGVPIYVRTGKRLPRRITEITVYFRRAPETLFANLENCSTEQNVLAIQVQPDESITLKMNSKPPGQSIRISPVDMEFSYDESFGVDSPEAYERLLLDAMRGDATLFTRSDEIEQAWELLQPILDVWDGSDSPEPEDYEAGTWGPRAAADLLRVKSHRWRRL